MNLHDMSLEFIAGFVVGYIFFVCVYEAAYRALMNYLRVVQERSNDFQERADDLQRQLNLLKQKVQE